jgi:hypothetical protein
VCASVSSGSATDLLDLRHGELLMANSVELMHPVENDSFHAPVGLLGLTESAQRGKGTYRFSPIPMASLATRKS